MAIAMSPLVSIMRDATRGVSRMLLRDYGEMQSSQDTKSAGIGSFVQSAINRSEDFLRKELGKWRKGCGFVFNNDDLSEEDYEYKWFVRPIEGMANFSRAIPVFAVVIALFKNDKAIAVLIDSPLNSETMWCEQGKGAFLENRNSHYMKLKINDRSCDTKEQYIVDFMGIKGKILSELGEDCILRSCGSHFIGYMYCASGRLDLLIYGNVDEYESIIGRLIMSEIGGVYEYKNGIAIVGKAGTYKSLFNK